ncbi:MAG: hypothetical protein QF638_02555 [Acidimicrobiales bacterium]|nr:hypothetical protein [Acidimicrobiales bacterium]
MPVYFTSIEPPAGTEELDNSTTGLTATAVGFGVAVALGIAIGAEIEGGVGVWVGIGVRSARFGVGDDVLAVGRAE